MKKKLINSQTTTIYTYQSYLKQMTSLASNVFVFNNLPEYIDRAYINKILLYNGSIAWFEDEVLGLIALPYSIVGKTDIYGRPLEIVARAQNGQYFRRLRSDEFVIMYDNSSYASIYPDIMQKAERLAKVVRTEDINTAQQQTPRIIKVPENKKESVKALFNEVDAMTDKVMTYDGIDLNDINAIMMPAPYLLDKLDAHIATLWAEFYQFIGIANLSIAKRERMITDEVKASQGGAIAGRFSRLTPREDALKLINKKFNTNITISYYDKFDEKGDDSDVYLSDDLSNESYTTNNV